MKEIKASTVLLVIVAITLAFFSGILIGKGSLADDYVIITQKQEVLITEQTEDYSVATSQSITVQASSETQTVSQQTADEDPRLDLNTATKSQLMELPGIGEVLAQRILDYREKNGPFESVDELDEVEGIGRKTLDKLFDLVKVGQ